MAQRVNAQADQYGKRPDSSDDSGAHTSSSCGSENEFQTQSLLRGLLALRSA
jgi:hypothetical protein